MKGDDCDGLVKLFDEDPESLAVTMAGNAGNAYSSMTAVEPDCLRCWRCLSRWNLGCSPMVGKCWRLARETIGGCQVSETLVQVNAVNAIEFSTDRGSEWIAPC